MLTPYRPHADPMLTPCTHDVTCPQPITPFAPRRIPEAAETETELFVEGDYLRTFAVHDTTYTVQLKITWGVVEVKRTIQLK